MNKMFFTAIVLLISVLGVWGQSAQQPVIMVIKDERAMAVHLVKKDETIYTIAQKYSVPAVVLSQNNDISYYETLEPNRKLYIPLGNYNYIKVKSDNNTKYRQLVYNTTSNDNYLKLSNYLAMDEATLISMNNGTSISSLPNNTLLVGWVYCEPDEVPKAMDINKNNSISNKTTTAGSNVVKNDTVKGPPSELELAYNYQTSNGTLYDSTQGMVTFFKPQTSINSKLLFAFSNEFARGRVIKVVNPTNKKYVFAKVIGPLPTTKQYINAKLGLDGRARAELATREVKLWCNFFCKY